MDGLARPAVTVPTFASDWPERRAVVRRQPFDLLVLLVEIRVLFFAARFVDSPYPVLLSRQHRTSHPPTVQKD